MKKIILVTGASSGMGKATALQLIDEGHVVYGAARRTEKMQDLTERGGYSLPLDVTDRDTISTAVERILTEQQQIDVLINNAGFAVYGAVEDVDLDDARRQFEVNLFGLAEVTKLVLPSMRKQGSGTIINISSMGGKMYTPLGAWYHATKHALEGWSDCLRLELKPFGIDVVIIEPGVIQTEFAEVMMKPMVDRSQNGPYASMSQRVAQATQESYSQGNASSASVIARLIAKAVAARRPRTRYAAGKYARLMMFLRKYGGR